MKLSYDNQYKHKPFQGVIEDLEFIATFQPDVKPCFSLKMNNSYYFVMGVAKLYSGENKSTTYNRILHLLEYVEQFVQLYIFSEEEEKRAQLEKLFECCSSCISGLSNLAITYPLEGFKILPFRVEKILEERSREQLNIPLEEGEITI